MRHASCKQLSATTRIALDRLARKYLASDSLPAFYNAFEQTLAECRGVIGEDESLAMFVIASREIRKLRTGYLGFENVFDSPPMSTTAITTSFRQALEAQDVLMTDDQIRECRIRFEDGLAIEEMASKLQKLCCIREHEAGPVVDLEDWKIFATSTTNGAEDESGNPHDDSVDAKGP